MTKQRCFVCGIWTNELKYTITEHNASIYFVARYLHMKSPPWNQVDFNLNQLCGKKTCSKCHNMDKKIKKHHNDIWLRATTDSRCKLCPIIEANVNTTMNDDTSITCSNDTNIISNTHSNDTVFVSNTHGNDTNSSTAHHDDTDIISNTHDDNANSFNTHDDDIIIISNTHDNDDTFVQITSEPICEEMVQVMTRSHKRRKIPNANAIKKRRVSISESSDNDESEIDHIQQVVNNLPSLQDWMKLNVTDVNDTLISNDKIQEYITCYNQEQRLIDEFLEWPEDIFSKDEKIALLSAARSVLLLFLRLQ